MPDTGATRPARPKGVNHLVLNVRDIEASHRFYTEVLGFEQCGTLGDHIPMTMQFYRSAPDHHHDIALVQLSPEEAARPVDPWDMRNNRSAINHIAVAYPDRESWLAQLEHLKNCDVQFLVRGDHGMTHSVYIADPDGNGIEVLYELPEEVWSGDVNAALNYFVPIDGNSPEAMQDNTDYKVFEKA
jgi:catechol-2,3-dioxygenase